MTPNTKDVILAILQDAGIALIVLGLLILPDALKLFKAKPEPKTGHGTQFQPLSSNGINKN